MRILSVIAVLGGCLLLMPSPSLAQLGPKNPQPPRPAPAPAPGGAGGALSKITPEQTAAALTAAGYRAQVATTKDKAPTKYVTTKMHNGDFTVTVYFAQCDAQGCGSLQFTSWFNDKLPPDWVNAFNFQFRFGRAALDKDGDLRFSLDVGLWGGITLENLKEYARLFDALLDELTKFDP